MLSDAQILSVLDTLNLGEVTEAQAALPRLMDQEIRDFADDMVEDHGEARQQVMALATTLMLTPAESPLQLQLDMQSDARVTAIMGAEASAVDDVYISGQVMAHTAAVALLGELATAADAQPLEDLIVELRGHVEEHLTEAMMLDE
jgi:putative membrane protein